MESPEIKSWCHIKENKIFLNGELLFEDPNASGLKAFAVKAFRHFKFRYPKFFKMDEISKLGFLTAELLMTNIQKKYPAEEVGIVLSNAQSTIVTDSNFQESINDYDNFFPSPSVFVYTLPNIMTGEISIRHKFRGENAFFIFADFNATYISDYINQLYQSRKIRSCAGGWVDQSESGYEAFMYWIEPSVDKSVGIKHKGEEVRKLYELI